MTFDASHWAYRITEEISSVQTVVSLFENRPVLKSALEMRQVMEDEEQVALSEPASTVQEWPGPESPDPESLDPEWPDEEPPDWELTDKEPPGEVLVEEHRAHLRDQELRLLVRGYETFRRQVVVIAVTYVELITEDFLKCVFTHRPERMYSYLNEAWS
jgi:hypothetical protein